MNDWIDWKWPKGAPHRTMPVEPGTLVDVRYRDGGDGWNLVAGEDSGPNWRDAEYRFWKQERHHSDIVAYRLAEKEEK